MTALLQAAQCSRHLVVQAADKLQRRAPGRLAAVVTQCAAPKRQQRGASNAAPKGGEQQPPTVARSPPPPDSGPLSSQRRQVLAEKLTETAKHIAWVDLEKDRPEESSREQVAALQARLGYRFQNLFLLRLSLVHSSAAPTSHNSVLAWVGDAALYLIVTEEVGSALGYAPVGPLRCGLLVLGWLLLRFGGCVNA